MQNTWHASFLVKIEENWVKRRELTFGFYKGSYKSSFELGETEIWDIKWEMEERELHALYEKHHSSLWSKHIILNRNWLACLRSVKNIWLAYSLLPLVVFAVKFKTFGALKMCYFFFFFSIIFLATRFHLPGVPHHHKHIAEIRNTRTLKKITGYWELLKVKYLDNLKTGAHPVAKIGLELTM